MDNFVTNTPRQLSPRICDYVALMFMSVASSLLVVLQIFFHAIYHYSVLQSGILLAAAGAGLFIGPYCSGTYKKLIKTVLQYALPNKQISTARLGNALSMLIVGSLFLCIGIAQHYYQFLVILFSLGFALAIFFPSNMLLLYDGRDLSDTVKITSVRRLVLNVGSGIGLVLLGGVVVSHTFVFNIISCLIILAGILQLTQIHAVTSSELKPTSASSVTCKIHNSHNYKLIYLWLLCVFISLIVYWQVTSTYSIALNKLHHFSNTDFSHLIIINVVLVLALQLVTPRIEKKIGIGNVALTGALLIGAGVCLILLPGRYVPVLSCIVWSLGEILLLGIMPVYIKVFAQDNSALESILASRYYSVLYLSRCAGPLLGSYLYELFADPAVVLSGFAILASIGGIGLALVYLFSKSAKLNEQNIQISTAN